MIADSRNGRTVQSTLDGQKIEMGIARGAEAHIMNILTDMYGDPEAACIREYSTNARDAHIEAGIERPIEVTLPRQLGTPTLKIKDYGVGLSVDTIHEIYSQYGASTKRDTNDQNGTFGIGCKAALTYADQFTLTSVRDGVRVTVVVGRDEDGAGTMTVLDTSQTDEPNGTEVSIPAKRDNSIARKAHEFFSVWAEGTVLIDGEVPAPFEGLKLSDDLYVIEGGQSKVVMGNVTYPVEIDLGVYGVNLLAFVPIGDVSIPPHRESLMDTAKTQGALAKIAQQYHAQIEAAIQRDVNAAPDGPSAIRALNQWRKYIPNGRAGNYIYKQRVIPQNYAADPVDTGKVDDYGDPVMRVMQTANLGYGRGSTDVSAVPTKEWPDTLWVKNFIPLKLNKQHRDKAKKFMSDKGIDLRAVGVTQLVTDPTAGPDTPFIDPALILDWADVKKVELEPRMRNGARARVPGSFDCYVDGAEYADRRTGLPGDSIDLSRPVFWTHDNIHGASYEARKLAAQYRKFTLVALPGGRIEKFKRDVPQAKHWQEGIREAAVKWAAGLTDLQRRAFAMHDTSASGDEFLANLDPRRVDDPAIKDGIKVARVKISPLVTKRGEFSRDVGVGAIMGEGPKWVSPMAAYPLTHGYRGVVSDHLYLYLNAAYAAAQEAAA